MNALALAAGVAIAVTAATHSLLGERRLLRPLFASGAFGASPRVGRAMRFTWHLATLLMLLTALTVAYLLLGLLALWMTRGRHVSGPLFTAAGLLALLA
jgi:cytochrome c-type biogenesis protein CcmH/NrfG